jgi:hypothetical protein
VSKLEKIIPPPGRTERLRLTRGLFAHVEAPDFPCVGAKSALARGDLVIEAASAITRPHDDRRIHERLVRWSRLHPVEAGEGFDSFAVIFAGPRDLDEVDFEQALWERLSALTVIDRARGHGPAAGFSTDPGDPGFALSFGGRAFFAVGLHPRSSRPARRAPSPAIVFNAHDQFARLRAEDRYERMREVILARDEALSGAPNPMLARHGETSEARQYSGRVVGDDWVCPFAPEVQP